MGAMNITTEHTGTESETVTYAVVLDEPWDYQEPGRGRNQKLGTLWRIGSLSVTYRRVRKYGEDWTPWAGRCRQVHARNVLKSGELGQRTPSSYENLLSVRHLGDSELTPRDWCADRLAPILAAAVAYRDEVAR